MEIVGTQISRDDRTSACRSFGSNYHPCSQSRKISIGVMVDSLEKLKPKHTNENEAYVPGIEKTCRKLSSKGDINEREQSKAKFKVHQIDQEHNTYPCDSTNGTQLRKPTSEAVHNSKPIDSPAGGSEFRRATVETSATLQSNSDCLKKVNRVYGRMEGDEEERERTNRLPSANAQEVSVPEREVAKDRATKPEDRRQVLKMKLWEILGANSSLNKQDSEALEMGANNLHPEPPISQKCEAVVKCKHNSDTNESDSQSSDHSTKRAVTRSLTRKKAESKAPTTKTLNVQKSTSTKKSLKKNIFSFNEGQLGKSYDALTGGAPKFNEKGLARKDSKSEAHRISFLEDPSAGEVQQEIDTSKTIKSLEKISSIGNSMRSSQKSPPKNRNLFGSENGNKENGFSLLLNNNIGGKGSKGHAPRFSFTENLRADDVQPALDISKTVKDANRASSIKNKNTTTSSKKFPPRNSSRLIDAENGNKENGSSLSSATKRGRKGSKAEGDNISFPETINAEEVQLAEDTRKTSKNVEKDSSVGKTTRFYRTSPTEKCNKQVDAKNGDRDSSLSAKKKQANFSQSRIPHHWVQVEDFVPFKNKTDTHADLQSSPFEVRTPAEALSPGSPPKANHKELDNQSPENYSFNSPVASTPKKYTPDAGKRTFNDPDEAEDSPLTKSRPTMAEKDSEDVVYISSPEKMDSESSKEGWATDAISSDFCTSENPEIGLYPNKRIRSQENFRTRRFSTISVSPKGLENNDESLGYPQTTEENGLANAISLLDLALQRVESKIKTVTSKKSTDVLMSVAEEVHLQLQNAESQFEKDVGKLTSLNKYQRKHLETEIEEQQKQLKVIYQKFKSDVNQHIQEHKSKVEVLQGQEKELRLFMGKRKASQKEDLKQLEESIQAQLSDAETRISNVHKMGREKMLELKQAVGKCLKEGMLG